MISLIFFFVAGLALLFFGANLLVDSSSGMARRAGIPAVVVGATVVAFATSAPEIAVSLEAAMGGNSGLALGNVLGSNIANILFILGVSALVLPLRIRLSLIRVDIPVMIGVSLLVYLLALDGVLGAGDGAVLLALFLGFLALQVRQARSVTGEADAEGETAADPVPGIPGTGPSGAQASLLRQALLFVVGLAMLVLGATWLVDSSVSAARMVGLSDLVIGLTVVALGTSLPEAATSVAAAWKGEPDLTVGNVVGSNIFNLLLVLGLAALLDGGGLQVSPGALALDLPFVIAVSIVCLPFMIEGEQLDRWEGGAFLAFYLAYTLYLVLDATQHEYLPLFNNIMLVFVLPLTLAGLLVTGWRIWKERDLR
ncbi:MAG: calcium/sodium antiporter [Balneolaceae bacterium]|nr:calcium/sodium antiporter [Balneolaceae bacterium]